MSGAGYKRSRPLSALNAGIAQHLVTGTVACGGYFNLTGGTQQFKSNKTAGGSFASGFSKPVTFSAQLCAAQLGFDYRIAF
jgi:hypothetical protein